MTERSLRVWAPTATELERVWRMLRMTNTFMSRDELAQVWRSAPWRFQLSERGDVAFLERWRDHMTLLAVKTLVCREAAVPAMMHAMRAVATAQGFTDVLSPLVPEDRVEPYERAGMLIVHRGVVLRRTERCEVAPLTSEGVVLERATPDDEDDVLTLDAACFADFWRYDRTLMRRYLESERVVVARVGARAVGYTQCSVGEGEGMLGRLAVHPAYRCRGVGSMLLADALGYMHRQGARGVTVYTQLDNERARRRYEAFGFAVHGIPQCLLAFDAIADA